MCANKCHKQNHLLQKQKQKVCNEKKHLLYWNLKYKYYLIFLAFINFFFVE